jgi:hypothetical protein
LSRSGAIFFFCSAATFSIWESIVNRIDTALASLLSESQYISLFIGLAQVVRRLMVNEKGGSSPSKTPLTARQAQKKTGNRCNSRRSKSAPRARLSINC